MACYNSFLHCVSLDFGKEITFEYESIEGKRFNDHYVWNTNIERHELNRMIDELKADDVVVIADLTRVSRSTKDLLMIVDKIKEKGAKIKSIKDTWLDTTSENPYNDFLLTVL